MTTGNVILADLSSRRPSLVLVTINIEEGMPGRGTEHPRAFALAPGGDSGAVPTTRPFERGQKWPLQTDVGANNFAPLRKYHQWRTAREIELSRLIRIDNFVGRTVPRWSADSGGVVCCVKRIGARPRARYVVLGGQAREPHFRQGGRRSDAGLGQ